MRDSVRYFCSPGQTSEENRRGNFVWCPGLSDHPVRGSLRKGKGRRDGLDVQGEEVHQGQSNRLFLFQNFVNYRDEV